MFGIFPQTIVPDVSTAVAVAALGFLLAAPSAAQPQPNLSPEAYLAWSGGKLIAAGRTEIDGHRMACGSSPTILDSHYNDFGGAGQGYIVLNPNLFFGLSTSVKLWIFSHECAHQSVGDDEVKADCAAVQRGRREGWLTSAGVAQICQFMQPARADRSHFTGTQRCALMRQCFIQQQPVHPPATTTGPIKSPTQ